MIELTHSIMTFMAWKIIIANSEIEKYRIIFSVYVLLNLVWLNNVPYIVFVEILFQYENYKYNDFQIVNLPIFETQLQNL